MVTIQNPEPRPLLIHPRLHLPTFFSLSLFLSRSRSENSTSNVEKDLYSTFATLAPSQLKPPKCQVSHPPTLFSFLSCTTCSPSRDSISKTNIPWERQHNSSPDLMVSSTLAGSSTIQHPFLWFISTRKRSNLSRNCWDYFRGNFEKNRAAGILGFAVRI